MLEIFEGAASDFSRSFERGDSISQHVLGTRQSSLDGAGGDVEHACDLVDRQVFPVVQLERDLVVDRDVSHGQKHEFLGLFGRDMLARCRPDFCKRSLLEHEFGPAAISITNAKVFEKEHAGNPQQVRTNTRARPNMIAPFQAHEERPLCQIVDVVTEMVELARKKPVHAREVPLQELVTRRSVSRAPGVEQCSIVGGHANTVIQ